MKIISSSIAAVALAALTLGATGTAHAAQYGIDDPSDTSHGSDLLAVKIRNRTDKLVVVTTHDNLRRAPSTGSGGAVFIDTDPNDPGPEYVFAGGFFAGTDYALVETEGFRTGLWGDHVDAAHSMKVNYTADTVRFVISRPAIGDADDVRVAIQVSGTRSDGTRTGLTDWLGGPRHFTPWIAKG